MNPMIKKVSKPLSYLSSGSQGGGFDSYPNPIIQVSQSLEVFSISKIEKDTAKSSRRQSSLMADVPRLKSAAIFPCQGIPIVATASGPQVLTYGLRAA